MKTQKEHKKATLMRWNKEELVDYIMMLEHNINVLNESFDNQYNNCFKLFNDMQTVKFAYEDAKGIIKRSLTKSEDTE